jgi:hypothetical protein
VAKKDPPASKVKKQKSPPQENMFIGVKKYNNFNQRRINRKNTQRR